VRKKKDTVIGNLLVEDYAAEGKSLARVDGKVIFIEQAVPGDIVTVRLTRNKKDWAEGRVIAYDRYAPDRIVPFCPHFGICGGCQWQMLHYQKQLFYKQQQVEQTLKRIGKVALPALLPVLGSEKTTCYRNKLEFTFSNKRYLLPQELSDPSVSKQADAAGYHAKGIFDKVVDIDICYLQEEPTNQIRKEVKKWGLENKWPFYDSNLHTGFLRTMQVRLCTTGELMVNIMFGYDDPEQIIPLLDHLLKQFPAITTLLYTINTKQNDSLYNLDPVVHSGNGYVVEKLEDFRFKIGPKSFFQTNTAQAEKLYQVTRSFAELSGTETVYDLYCGTGSIGIFLSGAAKKIIGVELVPEAIADARENARLNGIEHAGFHTGDVTSVCDDLFFEQHGKPDVIVTDPPRAGMTDRLVRKILDMEAERIVYVSCNPATQARDLNLLDEKYRVMAIQPVDMFPHTHHIENVVQLFRKY
jgi:23S rRNA (uracil1939-C5)-methyltransferase